MEKETSKCCSGFWRQLIIGLLSGLVPTIILLFFVCAELNVLKEELSYSREPIIVLDTEPRTGSPWLFRLLIANIGNETAENVSIQLTPFVATSEKIYSYGQHQLYKGDISGKQLGPREKMWPRQKLQPNEEVELMNWRSLIFLNAYIRDILPLDNDSIMNQDLYKILGLIQGQLILMGEVTYRRQSDYKFFVDTVFYSYMPVLEIFEDLNKKIGGRFLSDRIKKYLRNGPQLSINIMKNEYVIYGHGMTMTESPKLIRNFKRI